MRLRNIRCNLMDINITFNKSLLKTIVKQLTSLENRMATLEENTAIIADIAASVQANTDIIQNVITITEKIFNEVDTLVKAANADIPGLAELKAATLAQTALLIQATSANTAIDGLIPDLAPAPEPAPALEPAPVDPVA
jgi:hypothetical protein